MLEGEKQAAWVAAIRVERGGNLDSNMVQRTQGTERSFDGGNLMEWGGDSRKAGRKGDRISWHAGK